MASPTRRLRAGQADTSRRSAPVGPLASATLLEATLEGVRGLRESGSDRLNERWDGVDEHGRSVTLLCLRAEHARSASVRAAWLDRAACNQALSAPLAPLAPGVLPLLACGLHAGRPCAVVARADDVLPLSLLLAHLAHRRETPSVALALHVVRALCDDLAAAHALTLDGRPAPLFHADLSSDQVLVRADGRLQLGALGFWCALPAQRAYRLRASGGVAPHLAPEQAHGLPADARGDVYSLGVLLRRLVQGAHDAGTGDTRLIIEPAARVLIMLLGRLLAASPEDRIGSIDALRRGLDRLPRHAAGARALAQLHADARQAVQPAARGPSRHGHEATARRIAAPLSRRDPGTADEPLSEALTTPRAAGLARARHALPPMSPRGGSAVPEAAVPEAAVPEAIGVPASARLAPCAAPAIAPPPLATPRVMQAAPEVAGARCTLLGRPPPDALLGASCVPPLAASVAQRMVGAVETRPTRRQRWRDASETVFLPKARALTRFVATTPRLGRLSVILIALTVALAMVAAWLAIQLLD